MSSRVNTDTEASDCDKGRASRVAVTTMVSNDSTASEACAAEVTNVNAAATPAHKVERTKGAPCTEDGKNMMNGITGTPASVPAGMERYGCIDLL